MVNIYGASHRRTQGLTEYKDSSMTFDGLDPDLSIKSHIWEYSYGNHPYTTLLQNSDTHNHKMERAILDVQVTSLN